MIPYLIIGLLVALNAALWHERNRIADALARKCYEFACRNDQYEFRGREIERVQETSDERAKQIQSLSTELAESYMERLKLERQLEHLATGPNAIYRDNIRLRKELQAANTELLPKREAELRKLGYCS